jgi:hypothetical protein
MNKHTDSTAAQQRTGGYPEIIETEWSAAERRLADRRRAQQRRAARTAKRGQR